MAQKNEPLVDNRGTTIEVGSRVCFNLSGQIGVGVVESVRAAVKDGWKYIRRASIKVRQEHPHDGHVSEVKDPKNVMVIFEADSVSQEGW